MPQLQRTQLIIVVLSILALGVVSWIYIPPMREISNPSEQQISANYKPLTDYTQETKGWERHSLTDFPGFSFKFPEDWLPLSFWSSTPSNAYGAESPDFQSEVNFRGIFEGSILTFSVSPIKGYEGFSLEQIADSMSEGTSVQLQYYLIANIPGLKLKHYCCENGNNNEVLLFVRNEYLYKIEQNYKKNVDNPYPLIVEKVGSTVEFND